MASYPKTMSGLVIEEHGGPEVMKWKTDIPVRELKEGEMLVKNEFVGVNYIDTYFRTGLYKAPLPLITGREAAGTIVAVHPSVTMFKVGDRVVCMAEGAYAEYMIVPSKGGAAPLPPPISTQQAAAVLLQGLTALTLIREAAGIKQGSTEPLWALVQAAAGGTGSQLVQMLKAFGVKTIGTAGSPEKCEIASKSGASYVINTREEGVDVKAKINEITEGHGVDVIFDGVGKDTFDLDLEVIARKGTLITFGNASGPVPPLNLLRLMEKNVKLVRPSLSNYVATHEERETHMRELFGLIISGRVEVKIHEIYPLKDAARAHADLESRKTTGKLLLKV